MSSHVSFTSEDIVSFLSICYSVCHWLLYKKMHYYVACLNISYKDCSMYKIRRLEVFCKWVSFSISHLFWASFTGYPFNTVLNIFKILLSVYKSLNGTSPCYLAQKLHYRSHTRSLRSVSNELSMQPRSFTKTYGDRAFAVHAPREWNKIPYEIRKSDTISSFKRSLKTYLFTKFSNNRSIFLKDLYTWF